MKATPIARGTELSRGRGFDHCHDTRSNRLGQTRPGLDNDVQIRISGACIGACAGRPGRNSLTHLGVSLVAILNRTQEARGSSPFVSTTAYPLRNGPRGRFFQFWAESYHVAIGPLLVSS